MITESQTLSKKTEKTRKLIIDNASKIFFERGIRSVSVEELCRIIHVSKGTFYKFFPNRDALAETVLDEIISKAYPAIIQNFKSGGDVMQVLENHYQLMVDHIMSRMSVQMLSDIESQIPQLWERIEEARRGLSRKRLEVLKRWQKEGTIRKDIDLEVLNVLFEEILTSIFRPGFLMSKDLTMKQAGSAVKVILMYGILETNQPEE
ncbi:MAG: TetR/AcrR family transcriptional regulator [bacterium]|nr:TetR/AcrR family transcriptional regulator [bacterium]